MEENLSEKEFLLFLKYYTQGCDEGKNIYLSEIVISDESYLRFFCWLDRCEKAELLYFFTVTEYCNGYKLLHGFTNFEIKEFEDTNIFYFSFSNEFAFKKYLSFWKGKSSFCVVPTNLCRYVKMLAKAASQTENIPM